MNQTQERIIAVSLVLSLAASARAAYSPPPTWSPMTMLNVTFNTSTQRLDVVDEASTGYPVLAIDTYSDPTVITGSTSYGRPNNAATAYGSFDPAQPWTVLNGTAFSRRLGWNPGSGLSAAGIQAVYGTSASLWIELVTETAGLETYKAVGRWGVNSAGTVDANSVPVIDPSAHGYAAIFGTAGSSSKWQWDYQMDHNVYAVPASFLTSPNQLFAATYKVYVGDSQGNEVLNADGSSASAIETWTWQGPATLVPEPATMLLLTISVASFLGFPLRRP